MQILNLKTSYLLLSTITLTAFSSLSSAATNTVENVEKPAFKVPYKKSVSATMYKPLQCGCCDTYAEYLEKNGFIVDVKSLRSLTEIKRKSNVPREIAGCHTLLVAGYVIEGLVPIKTVNKLLKERPAISGIALPGMPCGAPGMMGRAKNGPLISYAFNADGSNIREYARD